MANHDVTRTWAILSFAATLLATVVPCQAQEEEEDLGFPDFPIVTALSDEPGDSVTWKIGENAPENVQQGHLLDAEENNRLTVTADHQVMIFSPTDEVVISALGPAEFAIRTLEDRILVELFAGRMMTTCLTATDEQFVYLTAPMGGEATPLFEGHPGHGWTMWFREGSSAGLAYQGDNGDSRPYEVRVLGKPQKMAAGQRVAIRDGLAKTTSIGSWLADNRFGFRDLGRRLGLQSARITRISVQGQLVQDLIAWDQRAQPEFLPELAENTTFEPEIRQVATVTAEPTKTTNRGGSARPAPVVGANEVPLLSPAAISVGGITAISLNSNAAGLARITNSRGLGFNGLSRLTVPGISNGTRNVGPAGLAAPRP